MGMREKVKKLLPKTFAKGKAIVIAVLFLVALICLSQVETDVPDNTKVQTELSDNQEKDSELALEEDSKKEAGNADFSLLPAYSSNPYIEINGNLPSFTAEELVAESFERYSKLDSLGRCGVAYACIGKDIMPTEERGSIGQVRPSGWHLVKYDIVDGKYLYNRCHLVGYQLAGENANTKNLITGTRYLNVEGMLPFENKIANYVENTGNHVLYRVTPIFEGENLLASGVQMEAYSVEDKGTGICFNVYVYNVQPGVTINYATGESRLTETGSVNTDVSITENDSDKNTASNQGTGQTSDSQEPDDATMVWKSVTGKKYHCVNDCGNMNPDKAQQLTKEEAEEQGLEPCKNCY